MCISRKVLLPALGIVAVGASVFFAGCGGGSKEGGKDVKAEKKREITVVSREESSGTRGAFDELMKITDGKTNELFNEAVIVSSTDEVASKVEVDEDAIGYTSVGSLNSKVKALSIDGVEALEDNVKNGTYKISRPFVAAKRLDAKLPIADDFIKFVASKQGQEIVAKRGYITVGDDGGALPEYAAAKLSGKLTISGSTSVEKVIESIKEKYIELNPGVKIEINYNGSSAGIKDCISQKSDVAMSSRNLKAEEKEQLAPTTFALDGIAVIVNQANRMDAITSDVVTQIFKGQVRYWNDVN